MHCEKDRVVGIFQTRPKFEKFLPNLLAFAIDRVTVAQIMSNAMAIGPAERQRRSPGMLAIDRGQQRWLVDQLARFVAEELDVKHAVSSLVDRTAKQAIESLAYREALIYREWQDAIGDAMIDRERDSPRKFRIIGFAPFTELIGTAEPLWFQVFATSLDDIDFEHPDRRDFRAHQLRKIANAVATMLKVIDKLRRSCLFRTRRCPPPTCSLKRRGSALAPIVPRVGPAT